MELSIHRRLKETQNLINERLQSPHGYIYKSRVDFAYCEAVKTLLDSLLFAEEDWIDNRTGIRTVSVTGVSLKIPVVSKFPRMIGKYVYPKLAFVEALWMLKGRTDIDYLNKYGVKYWDNWATLTDSEGRKSIGNSYGKQIRDFNGLDQLQKAIDTLRNNPTDRRNIINLWNPQEVLDTEQCALPPCLQSLQFVCTQRNMQHIVFDVVANMRSTDIFLGLPYDIMLFTFIGKIIETYLNTTNTNHNYVMANLVINCSNLHLYENHVEPMYCYVENYLNNDFDRIFSEEFLPRGEQHNKTIDEYLNYLEQIKLEEKNTIVESYDDSGNVQTKDNFLVIPATVAI